MIDTSEIIWCPCPFYEICVEPPVPAPVTAVVYVLLTKKYNITPGCQPTFKGGVWNFFLGKNCCVGPELVCFCWGWVAMQLPYLFMLFWLHKGFVILAGKEDYQNLLPASPMLSSTEYILYYYIATLVSYLSRRREELVEGWVTGGWWWMRTRDVVIRCYRMTGIYTFG